MSWFYRVTVWLRTCVGSDVSDAFDVLDEPDHEVRITMWHSIAWDHHTVTLDVMEQLLVRLLDRGLWTQLGRFAFAPLVHRINVNRYQMGRQPDSHLAVVLFFSTELAMRVIASLDHTFRVWLILDLFHHTPHERRQHVQPVLCHLLEWWKSSDREHANWYGVPGLHTITLDMVALWPIEVAKLWFHHNIRINRMLFFMPDTPAAHWLFDRLVYLRSEQGNLLAAGRHQQNRRFLCSADSPSSWMFRRVLDQIPNWFFQSKMADWMVCTRHATCFYALAQRERQLIHMLYQRRLNLYAQVVHRILTRKVHSRDIVTHIMRFMCSSTSPDRDKPFTRLCMAHAAHVSQPPALHAP